MIFGRGASGGGWLVANVWVRASPITIGIQIDTPHRRPPSRSQSASAPAVALAERLGFLEVLLRALLIDLRERRRRVAYNRVRQDRRATDGFHDGLIVHHDFDFSWRAMNALPIARALSVCGPGSATHWCSLPSKT